MADCMQKFIYSSSNGNSSNLLGSRTNDCSVGRTSSSSKNASASILNKTAYHCSSYHRLIHVASLPLGYQRLQKLRKNQYYSHTYLPPLSIKG